MHDTAPEAFTNTNFNWPTLTEMGVANCQDLDDAPELVHMALFSMDWLKRTQKSNGGVAGSIDGEQTQGRMWWESSDNAIFGWFATLPDHVNTLAYAEAAANCGRVLANLGYDTQAKSYLASAELAFDFGETIYQKLIPNIMTLTSPSGKFAWVSGSFVEETITSASASAIVVRPNIDEGFNTTNTLWLRNITGTFTNGQTITGGTTGVTATIASITLNSGYDRTYYYDAATQIRHERYLPPTRSTEAIRSPMSAIRLASTSAMRLLGQI